MSGKSSLNLARLLSTLNWAIFGLCLHVTLTYHRRWPATKEELANEKIAIVNWFGRTHVECGIWRLEYQSREKPKLHKVPHWHVLIWIGNRDAGDLETALRSWWAEGRGHYPNNSVHGVKITSGDQARGAWYLALHAAKRDQSPPFKVGRWWGFINREKLLQAGDLHNVGETLPRELVWWARLYRRKTGCRTRVDQGFSWFLPRAWQCEVAAWVRDRCEFEQTDRHRPRDPF